MAIIVEINPSYEWEESAKSIGVSHRELEVLTLLAKGFNNQDIANILRIQYQSVKNHMYNLNKKLKVHNSAQALSIAIGKNLIKVENTELKKPEEYSKAVKFLRFLDKAIAE